MARSYRFANEPLSNKDRPHDDANKDNPPRKKYGGKIELRFRDDGYTDVINSSNGDGRTSGDNAATFQKVWGWDKETSPEDSLEYLLFSADICLPPPISMSERFYFQARIDEEGDDEVVISLQEGSITVKRNIEAPGGGWWGIFRGADGILAQFREVGNFRCRAIERLK